MSYHRVLPPPSALANQDLAGQWLPRRDTLLQNKIMADMNSNSNENKVQVMSPASDSLLGPPLTDYRESSPQLSDASEEDVPASPKTRTRSSATLSNEGSNPSQSSVDFVTEENTRWNAPSSICLCQPDPKVPRPRNAFILYRQHHQAHVVAQNPGLANPEISKVIGDHWRQSPPEVKAHWKNLAEEEKIRHQRQYPDYRYQPRRNGRNNSLSSSSTPANSLDSENRRCPKCGGRSMMTRGAIPSVGYPMSASTTGPGTPFSANRPPSTPSTGSSAKRFLQGASSPPVPHSANNFAQRNRDLSNSISALGLATPRYKRPEDADFPMSPDAKRRRIMAVPHPGPRISSGPATPYAFPRRRESLPRPDFMNSPTFTMGPPPRPYQFAHRPDPSLTLPPLHNASVSGDSGQAKSVEAMVMSIKTLNKIRILSKVSPPLANPSPASPAFETRGLIIAIDGQEAAAVEQMTAYLNTVLTPSYAVKVFQPPILTAEDPQGNNTSSEATDTSSTAVNSLENCHLNMAKYLALSSQLKTYITTAHPEAFTSAASSPAVSPKSIPAKTRAAIGSTLAEPASASNTTTTTLVPIALVPSYQLTQTDASACRVPIDDNYAPTDHWQWMASMWRGVVGPDVTVAVEEVREKDSGKGKSGGAGAGAGLSATGGPGEVDVRLEDAGAVIVKVEKGRKVGEGALRRVGFEVGEWVRGRSGSR
ncbi:MAG: hypothetical protein LQ338_003331 [Usnochroma carphineum]|nr:MAG: hypothetical protein LQ338_003331 [Usnochroma carphineum]